ncbi:MAG TPA: hypothetical protein VJ800_06940, partial [Pseudolabrys sp.]|nr:hypothetical protein [Pseudolabrys sp.]
STSNRIWVADIAYDDDALGSESYYLGGAHGGAFEIIGNSLYLKAGTGLNFENQTTYSVTVGIDDPALGGEPSPIGFTLYIRDENEAPTMHGNTYYINEGSPSAGTGVGWVSSSDPDGGSYGNRTYSLAEGYGDYTAFSVGLTGQISTQTSYDYETKSSYSILVKVTDGAGAWDWQWQTININNVNEAPNFAGYDVHYKWTFEYAVSGFEPYAYEDQYWVHLTFVDPEGYWVTPYEMPQGWELAYIDGTYLFSYSYWYGHGNTYSGARSWNIRAYDPQGSYVDVGFQVDDQGMFWQTPIVLDLDGDGLDLVSGMPSSIWFDMDGDGYRDRTGWVGADDGILAIDRNGDGVIGTGDEISFTRDTDAAVSDLEGLRSYDTNGNGLVESGDAQFADLLVWRDANQDGVSQAEELVSLAQLGITAINLTLTTTGQTTENTDDNVVYGTTQFVRNDGTMGTVGDVSLFYVSNDIVLTMGGITQHIHAPVPDQLAPVVIDLDGDGVSLISRLQSEVRFDNDDDGVRQRTGWVDGGDGILALDRNQDGVIGGGREISFKGDLAGAVSDLEGLRAYDSNGNGLLEADDARFGEFLLWQDANQDGVSTSGELRSLADSGIAAINLTLRTTGQAIAGATDNVLYATTDVVMADGKRATAGDVFLSFDRADVEDDNLSDGDDLPTRTPDSDPRPRPEDPQPPPVEPSWWDALSDGPIRRRPETVWDAAADDAQSNFRAPGRSAHNVFSQDVLNPGRGSDWRTSLARTHGIGGISPVDLGLGLLEQQMLQMVAAMASFDPAGFDDGEPAPGQRRAEQGGQFLTAVPRFTNNNSPHVI